MRTVIRHRLWIPLLALAGVSQAAGGCARNPVTGQLQVALVGEAQEIELGRQTAAQAVQTMGLVPDEALQQYVQALGARLAAGSERPQLPWTFRVVDDPTPNAFAAPGGFIFLTRGMMSVMDSEAELVTVLGHEIGHVTAKHSVTAISRAQLAQLGLGLGSIAFPQLESLGGVASAGMQVLFLSYGRDAERQADELGFRYTLEQGYDPSTMADVFATIGRLGEASQRSAVPSWLQSHPLPADRVAAARERYEALQPPPANLRVDREGYLQRLDGMVHGVNPRNGFFQGGRFLHPDLRFQMAFPGGWQTQNMAQAVLAGSPRNDALMQLTLAEDPTPDAAAQRFFSQQGIAAGSPRRQSVNGLPATIVPFQAQTQQGVLQGLVAWIQHEGRVYQVIGYTPAQAYRTYERTFAETILSVAPLTDPATLAIQPDRIRIIRLPSAMTLAQFEARYPSAIPLAELAILNQVAGPETVMPAGWLVKRVVAGS
jgi:predicted Zn-dependent protease